jgi:acyl carrier protein
MNADRLILRWLTTRLASYLGVSASTIDPMVALADMGVDSMIAISFVDDVEERFDIDVDLAMVVFDYPTLSTIADLIEMAIAGEQKQAA